MNPNFLKMDETGLRLGDEIDLFRIRLKKMRRGVCACGSSEVSTQHSSTEKTYRKTPF